MPLLHSPPVLLVALWAAGALLTSCAGNHDPKILSFNHRDVHKDIFGSIWVEGEFSFSPGQEIPFEAEVIDQDGDEVGLWWPRSPPGFEFEPRARRGLWTVPEEPDFLYWEFWLVAVDDAPERGGTVLPILYSSFSFGGLDTGD